jgi:hypothetical protein
MHSETQNCINGHLPVSYHLIINGCATICIPFWVQPLAFDSFVWHLAAENCPKWFRAIGSQGPRLLQPADLAAKLRELKLVIINRRGEWYVKGVIKRLLSPRSSSFVQKSLSRIPRLCGSATPSYLRDAYYLAKSSLFRL